MSIFSSLTKAKDFVFDWWPFFVLPALLILALFFLPPWFAIGFLVGAVAGFVASVLWM